LKSRGQAFLAGDGSCRYAADAEPVEDHIVGIHFSHGSQSREADAAGQDDHELFAVAGPEARLLLCQGFTSYRMASQVYPAVMTPTRVQVKVKPSASKLVTTAVM